MIFLASICLLVGCSQNQSELLRFKNTSDGSQCQIRTAMTVRELGAIDGKITKKISLSSVEQDQYNIMPSCSCISVFEPENQGNQVSLSSEDTLVVDLKLPYAQQSGEHFVKLTSDGGESFTVNWAYNILQDVVVFPSVLSLSADGEQEFYLLDVSIRSSNKTSLNKMNIAPAAGTDFISDFEFQPDGPVFEELDGVYCQRWKCRVVFNTHHRPKPNDVLVIEAKNENELVLSTNVIVKTKEMEIHHPDYVDFGNIQLGNVREKKIRLGKPGGTSFAISSIECNNDTLLVDWNKQARSNDNHWLTLKLTAESKGTIKEQIVVSMEEGEPITLEVKGRVD